jgi:ABC-type multidrug transport system ATPase subunit
MERMKLTHARDKHISNFSSGMRQRVRLALAFFSQAELIFLDEPTTNLDSETIQWYHQELSTLPRTCTIFIASNLTTEYPSQAHVINILDFK